MNWFLLSLSRQNFFNFKTRARRAEFGWFFLVNAIISIVLGFISGFAEGLGLNTMAGIMNIISSVVSLILLIPWISLTTRRLHDLGWSGWIQLAVYISMLLLMMPISFFVLMYGKLFNWSVEITAIISAIVMFSILIIFDLVLIFKDGQPHPNKYGESPKYPSQAV